MPQTSINNLGKAITQYLENEIEDIESVVIDVTDNVTKDALNDIISTSPKR